MPRRQETAAYVPRSDPDMSKLDSGNVKPESISFNLRDSQSCDLLFRFLSSDTLSTLAAIESALESVAPAAHRGGVELVFVTPVTEDLPRATLLGDPHRTKQVGPSSLLWRILSR